MKTIQGILLSLMPLAKRYVTTTSSNSCKNAENMFSMNSRLKTVIDILNRCFSVGDLILTNTLPRGYERSRHEMSCRRSVRWHTFKTHSNAL